jgi:predicted ATPase
VGYQPGGRDATLDNRVPGMRGFALGLALARPNGWGGGVPGVDEDSDPTFALPEGTVTFLLTDIEGSTRLWASNPEAMAQAVPAHYALLAGAMDRHGGVRPLEQGEGDSVLAAFARASDAVAAAHEAQLALARYAWPGGIELRVRMALHTAEAQLRDERNYFGIALSRGARLRAIGRGGHTLLSGAVHDLVVEQLPDGVSLIDLGTHRLRDLERPERVFALSYPELPVGVESLRALDAPPDNVPDQLTSFVGRERELQQVTDALRSTRLLTVTGAGGCGKTRLAARTAADARDMFPDGVWWVELAPLAEGELIASALADVLGVRQLPGRNALDAAVDYLSGRRALVVIDNCEHLPEAAGDVAETLLRGCPGVTVLATSRAPLGIAGETDWRVPSLSLPALSASLTLDVLTDSEAVRLFIDRAAKVRPGFAVNARNAQAIAQVCHDLDGIPLAIELAAARVRVLSPDQIAAGLGDRFRLLTGGARSAMARQQTLRASVDWSYRLLSDQERVLFRRLATFTGGWTFDAVEHVCAGDGLDEYEILDLLTSLVDKSLVVADEGRSAVRYRMLETVRDYALELLHESGELDLLRGRHRDYFLALAETAEPNLVTATESEWLEVLDPEATNLQAAIDWGAATDPEQALRLCLALTLWWKARGRFAAAELAYGRALDAADPSPSALRARVLWGRAYLLTYAGDFMGAIGTAQQALAMAEEVQDNFAMARALEVLGTIQLLPDPVGSREPFTRAIELARRAGDDWLLSWAIGDLGYAHLLCDEFADGERLLNESLPIVERSGNHEGLAWHWVGLSLRPAFSADLERVLEVAHRAIDAAREVGEPVTEGFAHALIAMLESAQGRPEAALRRLEESKQRVIDSGGGMAVPITEIALARANAGLGDLDRARAGLEPVVASGADFGYWLAQAQVALADVMRVQGDLAGAQRLAEEALQTSERVSSPSLSALSREVLGRLAVARGSFVEAEASLHAALEARAELQLRLWLPQTLDALAELAAGVARNEEAIRLLGAAERARADVGIVRWPPDEARIAALVDSLRSAMGADAYAAARAEGAALSLDEAIASMQR